MKRIFSYITILAVALMSASCIDQVFPKGTEPTPVVKAPGISINISNVTDESFDVTIAPDGAAAYYSYLVDDGAPVELAAEDIYGVAYTSVAQGTVSYKQHNSYTFTVNAEPNTPYTVYAVAGSVEGNPGDVVVKQVLTTDGVAPALLETQTQENMVLLQFSEGVYYNDEVKLSATIYASYSDGKTSPWLSDEYAMGKAAVSVQVAGDQALLTVDTEQAGATYAITIPDGAFVDAVGNPLPGVTCGFKSGKAYANPAGSPFVGGKLAKGTVEVVAPDLTDYKYEDFTKPFVFQTKTYVQVVYNKKQLLDQKKTPISYTLTRTVGSKTIVEKGELETAPYYGAATMSTFQVRLPEEPMAKDFVEITIPAGVFVDVYGNESPEMHIGPIQYKYQEVYPVCGQYTVNAKRPFPSILQQLDETHYLLGANWFGLFKNIADPVLLFELDEPNHRLVCNGKAYDLDEEEEYDCFGQAMYWYNQEEGQLLVFWGGGDGDDPIVIDYNDEGILTTMSYCDYSVGNTSGKYLGTLASVEDGTTLTYVPAAGASVKATSSVYAKVESRKTFFKK